MKNGTVRGMLCLKCNTALGLFHDDPNLLAKAITYLNHHNMKDVIVPDALPENI